MLVRWCGMAPKTLMCQTDKGRPDVIHTRRNFDTRSLSDLYNLFLHQTVQLQEQGPT